MKENSKVSWNQEDFALCEFIFWLHDSRFGTFKLLLSLRFGTVNLWWVENISTYWKTLVHLLTRSTTTKGIHPAATTEWGIAIFSFYWNLGVDWLSYTGNHFRPIEICVLNVFGIKEFGGKGCQNLSTNRELRIICRKNAVYPKRSTKKDNQVRARPRSRSISSHSAVLFCSTDR